MTALRSTDTKVRLVELEASTARRFSEVEHDQATAMRLMAKQFSSTEKSFYELAQLVKASHDSAMDLFTVAFKAMGEAGEEREARQAAELREVRRELDNIRELSRKRRFLDDNTKRFIVQLILGATIAIAAALFGKM